MRWMLTAERLRLLRALRSFAQDAGDAVLTDLRLRLEREPARSAAPAPDAEPSAEWRPGPLPPDTWGWGAVKVRWLGEAFLFADFRGDHAICHPGEFDVKPETITLWCNPITEPPADAPPAEGGGE